MVFSYQKKNSIILILYVLLRHFGTPNPRDCYLFNKLDCLMLLYKSLCVCIHFFFWCTGRRSHRSLLPCVRPLLIEIMYHNNNNTNKQPLFFTIFFLLNIMFYLCICVCKIFMCIFDMLCSHIPIYIIVDSSHKI